VLTGNSEAVKVIPHGSDWIEDAVEREAIEIESTDTVETLTAKIAKITEAPAAIKLFFGEEVKPVLYVVCHHKEIDKPLTAELLKEIQSPSWCPGKTIGLDLAFDYESDDKSKSSGHRHTSSNRR